MVDTAEPKHPLKLDNEGVADAIDKLRKTHDLDGYHDKLLILAAHRLRRAPDLTAAEKLANLTLWLKEDTSDG